MPSRISGIRTLSSATAVTVRRITNTDSGAQAMNAAYRVTNSAPSMGQRREQRRGPAKMRNLRVAAALPSPLCSAQCVPLHTVNRARFRKGAGVDRHAVVRI
jgi:hypothetical protein